MALKFHQRKNIFFFLSGIFLFSCSYDKGEPVSINDGTLFDLVTMKPGFQYYKRTTDTLLADVSSPHGSYIRIRFNETAVTGMNSDLSNLIADRFPAGSLIVKEIYDAPGGNLNGYAVMFKSLVDANTEGGWIWAEYGPGAEVIYSTSLKGVDCIGCHSSAGNVDMVRTFSLH